MSSFLGGLWSKVSEGVQKVTRVVDSETDKFASDVQAEQAKLERIRKQREQQKKGIPAANRPQARLDTVLMRVVLVCASTEGYPLWKVPHPRKPGFLWLSSPYSSVCRFGMRVSQY